MRGDLTLLVLEIIQASVATTGDILDVLTYYGRTAHYQRLRNFYARYPKRGLIFARQIEILKNRQRMSNVLSKLKRDGLVVVQDGSMKFKLTGDGHEKLEALKKITNGNPDYRVKPSQELKIVIFDIPESESGHRAWLRLALKNLKFSMLQKSVWVGNSVLPEEFINDLHIRGIDKFVEILAVTKSGTLRQIH